jgi:hypothetical protein
MSITLRAKDCHRNEQGTSALEITLMLPIMLILLLMFLQVSLIVQAKFVVNHAAMAAVRSAIVTIPAVVRSQKTGRTESRNIVRLTDTNSPKLLEIQRAAAYVLTSISPKSGPNIAMSGATIDSPANYAALGRILLSFSGLLGGPALAGQIIQRAPYAYDSNNTRIEIIPTNQRQREGRFMDHDDVTIRLIYRYYLTVPGASRILGKRFAGGGYYVDITEQYTLQIEGEPIFPPNNKQKSIIKEIVVTH